MHVDLNSCFASIEQQANPLLRDKPVGVASYNSPGGIILAASYAAKALGITTGTSVRDAKKICPDIVIMMPDPDKYFDAHRRFSKILGKYTNSVVPKSVDEFVIDFAGSPALRHGLTMEEIGKRIKQDVKDSLGEYVTINVGIGPNRFLAKLAAGLHKPDGLDTISATNLRDIYDSLELIDLPGINHRYSARLKLAGIFTPLEFLDAPLYKLQHQVFQSIIGFYWYLRLKGHEIDSIDFGRKSFGQQYALGNKTDDIDELERLLMKLCEKTGRRLRRDSYQAQGIRLWLMFKDYSYFNSQLKTRMPLYSTQDIFNAARHMLVTTAIHSPVTNMSVTVYDLKPTMPLQLGLFDDTRLDSRSLAYAADDINDRYGEFTLVPALMANMQDVIIKRVAFGKPGY